MGPSAGSGAAAGGQVGQHAACSDRAPPAGRPPSACAVGEHAGQTAARRWGAQGGGWGLPEAAQCSPLKLTGPTRVVAASTCPPGPPGRAAPGRARGMAQARPGPPMGTAACPEAGPQHQHSASVRGVRCPEQRGPSNLGRPRRSAVSQPAPVPGHRRGPLRGQGDLPHGCRLAGGSTQSPGPGPTPAPSRTGLGRAAMRGRPAEGVGQEGAQTGCLTVGGLPGVGASGHRQQHSYCPLVTSGRLGARPQLLTEATEDRWGPSPGRARTVRQKSGSRRDAGGNPVPLRVLAQPRA